MRGESQPECRECGGKGQESGDWCGCQDSLEAESLGDFCPKRDPCTPTQCDHSHTGPRVISIFLKGLESCFKTELSHVG